MSKRDSVFFINGEGLCEKEGLGIHRYAVEIVRRLDVMMGEALSGSADRVPLVYVVIPAGAQLQLHLEYIPVKVTRQGADTALKRRLWQQRCFPSYVRSHGGIGLDMSLAIPGKGCRYIVLHDCIMEKFPDIRTSLKGRVMRKYYMNRVRCALKHGANIITVSEYSRMDLHEWYGIDPEQIRVIGNGWEHMQAATEDDSVFERLGLSGVPGISEKPVKPVNPDKRSGQRNNPGNKRKGENGYYFSLGSKYRYKNFGWIREAAKLHPEDVFVAAGKSFDPDTDRELMGDGIPENLVFTGYLNDGEIKALMKHCKAFIHPSFYEGFGIPPLEALSLGVPVISSDRASLPEVLGDAVHYIDPEDPSVDLDKLLKEPVGPSEPVLQKHTWNRSAEKYWELFLESL